MIANGIGGANTKTGLVFEGKVIFIPAKDMSLIALERCFMMMNW